MLLLGTIDPSFAIAIIPSLVPFPHKDIYFRIFCFVLFAIISLRTPLPTLPAPGSSFWYLEMQVLPSFLQFFTFSLILCTVIPVGLMMLLPISPALHFATVSLLIHSGYSSLGDVFWSAIIVPLLLLERIPHSLILLTIMTMVAIPPLANGWLLDEVLSANPYFASTLILSSIRFVLAPYLIRRELS